MSESRISSIYFFIILFFELKDFLLAEFKQERGFDLLDVIHSVSLNKK